MAGGQPALEIRLLLAQLDAGDADLLEAQFAPPVTDRLGEGDKIGGGGRHGWRQSGAGWV
ncbi:hypothetical protein D9M71_632440 [compost metagenome]